MSISFFEEYKPIVFDAANKANKINWKWVLQRTPILALGIDSSYNVAQYIGIDGTPLAMQIVTGVTFDLIFVGLIALADQFRNAKLSSQVLFWGINGLAMVVSAILGTLAYSHGSYANVTLEAFTRGSAYPLLGLLYNLYYHAVTSELADDKRKALELQATLEAEQRKELKSFPHQCDYCERRFETVKQRNGHMARCQSRISKA